MQNSDLIPDNISEPSLDQRKKLCLELLNKCHIVDFDHLDPGEGVQQDLLGTCPEQIAFIFENDEGDFVISFYMSLEKDRRILGVFPIHVEQAALWCILPFTPEEIKALGEIYSFILQKMNFGGFQIL